MWNHKFESVGMGTQALYNQNMANIARNIDMLLLTHALLSVLSCEPGEPDSTNRWTLCKGVDDTQLGFPAIPPPKRQQLMDLQHSSFACNCYTSQSDVASKIQKKHLQIM
jgi:hypothetical protein